ncbi:entry exclusion lipoprotein TrbK [Pseudomonas sp. NPDC089752]|uniref:entry exclusion lipoprotein TrbK n=1 Tax=Pseudomonas sp. NPDC089752 TaxID=3364472 RepID=UPI003811B9C9
MKKVIKSFIFVMAIVALGACNKGNADYEINDKNCATEHLKTLPEDAKRDTLVEGCMTR